MIPLNDFARQWTDTGADVLAAVAEVGESGRYIQSSAVMEFETRLAGAWGVPFAAGVASGLDAIELALRVLGARPGDVVLTSPVSAFATPLAILRAGCIPYFADCDAHGLVDLDECRRVLAARPDIRFFVPVHLYGHSLDLGELRDLRDRFELRIVEDCAQSILATHNGTPTGTVGQFAATSFYPTKNLGALGDGGAVLAHNFADYAAVRTLANYGQSAKYRHDVCGANSRLDELQAAILTRAFLPRLPAWTEARRRCAAAYLAGIDTPALEVPRPPAGYDSCWHLFPVLARDAARKAELMTALLDAGITTGEHYPLALVEQKALDPWRGQLGSDCPRAREFCRRELSLPIHPYLSSEEIDAVIRAANELA